MAGMANEWQPLGGRRLAGMLVAFQRGEPINEFMNTKYCY
jgi:hypothetical protein